MWRFGPDAWRLSSRLSAERIERFLRFRTARGLPASFRARFLAMRIPEEAVAASLGQIRSLPDWMPVWNDTAQRFLGEARREDADGRWLEAAMGRRNAAMCYHTALLVTDTDPRTIKNLRGSAVNAFAQGASRLYPETARIGVPWRAWDLPAYLAKPDPGSSPAPVAVLLNGATTSKEELLLWSDPLLDQGIAVLALDWPGTGEATELGLSPDCDDMTDGILEIIASDPELDPSRVILVGFSLGGAVAIQAAALDRRIAACVAVTPPFEPSAWIDYVNPIVRQQLHSMADEGSDADAAIVDGFGLASTLPRLRSPLLVFGAGRDLVVPPEEAMHVAAAAGENATLVWYPRGSHGLYEQIDDWMAVTGAWITSLLCAPTGSSTQVEPTDSATVATTERSPR